MTVREQCPQAKRKTGSPALFCEDGTYCAHQYLCPATRQYENSGWRICQRVTSPSQGGQRRFSGESVRPDGPTGLAETLGDNLPGGAGPTGSTVDIEKVHIL